ncbi:MAG: alpha/beta hydrolase [Phycisphaerales bacterium]
MTTNQTSSFVGRSAPVPVEPMAASGPDLGGSTKTVTLTGWEGVPVPVEVQEVGIPNGRPIVFLHGLVGLNDHWEELVKRIMHRSRCVMLEMPLLELEGEDCSIHGATELAVRFLREYLQSQPSVLVGNSFGGHIAGRIAIENPELVQGLVLAGASGILEKSMVSDIQIKPSRQWLERKIGELFFDQRHMNPADVDRAHKVLTARGSARAMVRLSRTARRNHLGEDLCKVQCPTLLVWGKQDVVTPPEACEQFAANIPKNRVVWLDQCGHVPMVEKVEDFARELNSYLDLVG